MLPEVRCLQPSQTVFPAAGTNLGWAARLLRATVALLLSLVFLLLTAALSFYAWYVFIPACGTGAALLGRRSRTYGRRKAA